ncbi:hypothetical protein [Paenibacillus sp. Z6-24]
MNTIWNNIVSSTSLINTITIFSLILTVIFFIYQEQRSRKEHTKERLRLRDEITNLIIRNHVSNGVSISAIDLQVVIDGFESLRNSQLKLSTIEVIEMIYAKVYENEHISNDMRVQLLKELEEILSNYSIGLLENKLAEYQEPSIGPRMMATISFSFFSVLLALASYLRLNENIDSIASFAITIALFLIYLYITPKLNLRVAKFINGRDENETENQALLPKDSQLKMSEFDNVEEVEFDQLFKNKEFIIKVMEQRMIFEKILSNLYMKFFNEEQRLSTFRMISLLVSKNILDKTSAQSFKRLYQYSSFVIHQGELHPEVTSYEDLLNNFKSAIVILNQTIKSLDDKQVVERN